MTLEDRIRKDALEQFAALLESGKSQERDWQQLFNRNPFVLTDSLPLKLTAIYPQVILETGRPDFVFSEASTLSGLGCSGVIELKRPRDPILRVYSSTQVYPSSKLVQATHQVQSYLDEMAHAAQMGRQFSLALGHSQHGIIIMGQTAEILEKCQTSLQRAQLAKLLPRGLTIIPYDHLFERFRAGFPPLLILEIRPHSGGTLREPRKFHCMADEYDIYDYAVLKVITANHGLVRVPKGRYRQVYGAPRKLWPIGKGRFQEFYEYELQPNYTPSRFEAILQEARQSGYPVEAFDIEGEFLSEDGRWGRVSMQIRDSEGQYTKAEFVGWDFALYEGDKVYLDDSTLYINAESGRSDEASVS